MNKEFVPYEQALALKELGFDEPCFAHFVKHYDEIKCILDSDDFDEWWTNNSDNLEVKAPLYQQAFSFFREKHDLVHRINRDGGWWICAILDLYDENDQGAIETYLENTNPQTYEEAELACLLELINICKKK